MHFSERGAGTPPVFPRHSRHPRAATVIRISRGVGGAPYLEVNDMPATARPEVSPKGFDVLVERTRNALKIMKRENYAPRRGRAL